MLLLVSPFRVVIGNDDGLRMMTKGQNCIFFFGLELVDPIALFFFPFCLFFFFPSCFLFGLLYCHHFRYQEEKYFVKVIARSVEAFHCHYSCCCCCYCCCCCCCCCCCFCKSFFSLSFEVSVIFRLLVYCVKILLVLLLGCFGYWGSWIAIDGAQVAVDRRCTVCEKKNSRESPYFIYFLMLQLPGDP